MTKLATYDFHGDEIILAEHEGEPYVPAKPISDNLGLAWQGQHERLRASERWGIRLILIPSLGGSQQTLCLPLRKVAAWLASISPEKVAESVRPKLIRYQEECDDALFRYWNEGFAARPGVAPETKTPPATVTIPYVEYSRLIRELYELHSREIEDRRYIRALEGEVSELRDDLYSLDLRAHPHRYERVRGRKSRRESELTPDEISSVRAILRSARKGS